MTEISEINFTTKTGEQIVIRSPKKTDFESFNRFIRGVSEQSSFTNQYPNQPDKNKERTLSQWKTANTTKENCVLLAFYKGEVIGSCGMFSKHDHPWFKKSASFGMSVSKAFWRKGIGGKLLKLLIKQWEKAEMNRLEGLVDTKNFRGINLYLNHGFKIEGHHRRVAVIDGKYRDKYTIALVVVGKVRNYE
ncbi:MAG: GNAT family N-acetyltransferase [Alphaproteobacteria bacterium]|nr:MAG: hypothetical protein B6I23_01930 [Rickettsiaceae bacterium 4572_127]